MNKTPCLYADLLQIPPNDPAVVLFKRATQFQESLVAGAAGSAASVVAVDGTESAAVTGATVGSEADELFVSLGPAAAGRVLA